MSLLAGVCLATCAVAAPHLRTSGLHLIDPRAGTAAWLGPGGHPAWAPDGRTLYVEAHHGPFAEAPAGPLYAVSVPSGDARGLEQSAAYLNPLPSPDGKWLAALVDRAGVATVVILEAWTGKAAGAQVRLGPLTARSRDAFAWAGAGSLVVATPDGLFQVQPTGLAEPLAAGSADGLWPSPDGRLLAIRSAEQVALLSPAGGEVTVLCPVRAGVTVEGLRWAPDNGSVWLHTMQDGVSRLERLGCDGTPLASHELAGRLESQVGWSGDEALFLTREGETVQLLAQPPGDEPRVVASVAAGVPLRPHPLWLAPAPAASPDGRRWVVSLGRTDRWGTADRDRYQTTDVTVAGQTVSVTRRGRNVGASGTVHLSSDLRFGGRAQPRADSRVVGSTRPGTFRWSRPAPPRWVVLHHTAVSSDSGSLNALTSPSNGRIAQLYEDLTPDSLLGAEPGTIGVNYLVLRSGTVLQLAEERYLTRHAGTGQWGNRGPIYDFNVETIGIEIVGRGNDFTSGQVRNVGRLVADICRRQAIPLRHVAGQAFAEGVLYHRDFAGGLRGKPDPAGWPWSTMMRHAQAYLSGS